MPLYTIVILELVILFFLSGRLAQMFYTILFLLTRSKHASIALLTFLYLPGTVVHEFAHLIVAEILRVPTGAISFTPELESDDHDMGTEVTTGSVKVGRSDPIRRYLIGFAPLFFGLAALIGLVLLFQYFWPLMDTQLKQIGLVSIIGYLMFAVSNNMFSSKKDLEGFWVVALLGAVIFFSLYIAGFRFTLTGKVLEITLQILDGLSKALGIVVAVNLVVFALNLFFLRALEKLFRIKIS